MHDGQKKRCAMDMPSMDLIWRWWPIAGCARQRDPSGWRAQRVGQLFSDARARSNPFRDVPEYPGAARVHSRHADARTRRQIGVARLSQTRDVHRFEYPDNGRPTNAEPLEVSEQTYRQFAPMAVPPHAVNPTARAKRIGRTLDRESQVGMPTLHAEGHAR